jgi:hypothetical protein
MRISSSMIVMRCESSPASLKSAASWRWIAPYWSS